MVLENEGIPSFTCNVTLQNLDRFYPLSSEIMNRHSFAPIWNNTRQQIPLCIESKWHFLKPKFSFIFNPCCLSHQICSQFEFQNIKRYSIFFITLSKLVRNFSIVSINFFFLKISHPAFSNSSAHPGNLSVQLRSVGSALLVFRLLFIFCMVFRTCQ